MTRHLTPPNTDLSLDEIRNRLQDKLKHLQERIDNLPPRLKPHAANEIAATERRLISLNEKAMRARGQGE